MVKLTMRLVLKGLKMLEKMEDNTLYDATTIAKLFRIHPDNVWKLMSFFEKQGKIQRIKGNYGKTYFKKVSSSDQPTHTQPPQSEGSSSQSPQQSQ